MIGSFSNHFGNHCAIFWIAVRTRLSALASSRGNMRMTEDAINLLHAAAEAWNSRESL